jgi:hypothetical protein
MQTLVNVGDCERQVGFPYPFGLYVFVYSSIKMSF